MAVMNEAYRYASLFSGGDTFRVLYLLPGVGNASFEGDLLEIPITARSGYAALSYAWEDTTETSKLSIHGYDIGITTSLANALRRLRDPTKPRALWIDAVCINQADKDEKNMQIPLMAHIYADCPRVLVYLGVQKEGSQMIPEFCDMMKSLSKTTKPDPNFSLHTGDQISIDRFSRLGIPEEKAQIWTAARNFFHRPWFSRIWVVQEVVLAQRVEMVCGDWSFDFDDLVFAVRIAMHLNISFTSEEHGEESHSLVLLALVTTLRICRRDEKHLELLQILEKCRRFSASDAHDYCYGLLALAIDGQDPALAPDYRQTVRADYIRYAKYSISKGDGIRTLCSAAGKTLELPSWVPDWSHRERVLHVRLSQAHSFEREWTRLYAAATSRPQAIYLRPSLPNVLVVRGVFFDTIAKVKKNLKSFDNPTQDNFTTVLRDLRGIPTEGMNFRSDFTAIRKFNQIQAAAEYLCNSEALLKEFWRSSPYPTGEDLETVLWRTGICDNSGADRLRAPATHRNFFQAFKLSARAFFTTWPGPDLTYDEISTITSDMKSNAQDSKTYIRLVEEWWYGRIMGRTSTGFVGQIPSNSREGDKVFVPFGSPVPFIVRKRYSASETYELIGEAYIHGIMYGELSGLFGTDQEDIFLD